MQRGDRPLHLVVTIDVYGVVVVAAHGRNEAVVVAVVVLVVVALVVVVNVADDLRQAQAVDVGGCLGDRDPVFSVVDLHVVVLFGEREVVVDNDGHFVCVGECVFGLGYLLVADR